MLRYALSARLTISVQLIGIVSFARSPIFFLSGSERMRPSLRAMLSASFSAR